jgi:hypothetical protein
MMVATGEAIEKVREEGSRGLSQAAVLELAWRRWGTLGVAGTRRDSKRMPPEQKSDTT